MTNTNTATLVSVDATAFINALKAALLAASDDTTRAHLNCVQLSSPKDGTLRIQATNGHWLWRHDVPCECSFHVKDILISRNDVEAIVKRHDRKASKGQCYVIAVSDGRVNVIMGNAQSSYAPVDAQFPPAETVIPKTFHSVMEIGLSTEYMEDIAQAFRLVGITKFPHVTMTFTDSLGPIKFTSAKCEGAIAVCMPVRI